MNYDEHIELRNDLYHTSLKLFHCNYEWLSEYIPSVSRWRVKVILRRDLQDSSRELESVFSEYQISEKESPPFQNKTNDSALGGESSLFEGISEEVPRNSEQNIRNFSNLQPDQISIKLPSSTSSLASPTSHSLPNPAPMWNSCGQLNTGTNPDSSLACGDFVVVNNPQLRSNLSSDLEENADVIRIELVNLEESERGGSRDEKERRETVEWEQEQGGKERSECESGGQNGSDSRVYHVLTGRNQRGRREFHRASLFGLTLWEYLPLILHLVLHDFPPGNIYPNWNPALATGIFLEEDRTEVRAPGGPAVPESGSRGSRRFKSGYGGSDLSLFFSDHRNDERYTVQYPQKPLEGYF
ncbi:putative integral membrane protein [Cryptosporidium felis]|nr:putative integral membrane protein [Cryptosporidium felis]